MRWLTCDATCIYFDLNLYEPTIPSYDPSSEYKPLVNLWDSFLVDAHVVRHEVLMLMRLDCVSSQLATRGIIPDFSNVLLGTVTPNFTVSID